MSMVKKGGRLIRDGYLYEAYRSIKEIKRIGHRFFDHIGHGPNRAVG